MTDPLGNVVTTVYDDAGNVASRTNARGFTTSYSYDALNRLTQSEDALGHLATIVYDDLGNVQATIDPLGRRTTFVYDALNRRIATHQCPERDHARFLQRGGRRGVDR